MRYGFCETRHEQDVKCPDSFNSPTLTGDFFSTRAFLTELQDWLTLMAHNKIQTQPCSSCIIGNVRWILRTGSRMCVKITGILPSCRPRERWESARSDGGGDGPLWGPRCVGCIFTYDIQKISLNIFLITREETKGINPSDLPYIELIIAHHQLIILIIVPVFVP